MLKKTITYTNPFTDEEVTEDHYFHISKADLIEMEVSRKGGMEKYLTEIVEAGDGKTIMAEFKDLIKRSYGKKVGERFVKSEENWQEFVSSEAYSTLFYELCTDATAASTFVNGIIPKGLDQEVAKFKEAGQVDPSTETPALDKAEHALSQESTRDLTQATPENPIVLTQAEMVAMDSEVLKSGIADGRYKLS